MRTAKLALAAVCVGLALAGGQALGDAFERARVAADAQWIVHADIEQLKTTAVGQYLLTEMQTPEAERKFAAFAMVFAFDPRRDLNSVTMYGTGDRREDSAVLFRGTFKPGQLLTLVQANETYQAHTNGARVIHEWIDDRKNETTFGAFHGDGTVVLSGSMDTVVKALDVLEAKAPGLANGGTFGDLDAVRGSAFLLAVANLGEVKGTDPKAATLRNAESGMVTIGEKAGRVSAAIRLQAKTVETAAQMEAVVRGMLAIGVLAQEQRPQLAKLAQAVSVSVEGRAVSVMVNVAAEDLIGTIKEGKAAGPAAGSGAEPVAQP